MEREKLIRALRCSASAHPKDEELNCEGCPYKVVDEIPEEYRAMANFEKDGKLYVVGCDVDRMALDAADMLEQDAAAAEDFCDNSCRWPIECCKDGEALEEHCSKCKMA